MLNVAERQTARFSGGRAITTGEVAVKIRPQSHAFAEKRGTSSGVVAIAVSILCLCLNPTAAWATEPPVSTSPPTIEGEATVDSPLEGGEGAWEGTTPFSYQWQWLRCDAEGGGCEPIEGAIEPNRPVKELDFGSTLRLKVTATNEAGSASSTSSATAVITEPEPPVNTSSPSLEGEMLVGETALVDVGTWSHHPQEFDFSWQLCDAKGENCEALEGETEQTLLLPDEAEGGRIRGTVSALNRGGEGTAHTAVSAPVGPMITPANEIRPSLTDPEETKPLEARVGEWSGGRPMSFTYQWFICDGVGGECAEIPGATKVEYTPTSEDVDGRLKVKVTATNAAGSANETSNASSRVDESAPWFSGNVEIQGEVAEEGELSVDISTLHGSKPMEVEYQWQRCFEGCHPIPSATAATYAPGAEDVAHRLRVLVTAHNNSSGEGQSRTNSPYSSPVEPAETEGSPRLADFPGVDGLPSTGEVLTATDGVWRGAGEISTSVRWQRCAGAAETCEDIEGATEPSYELGAEETGSRIRVVVSASSEEGEAEAGSALTAPILPAENTVWTLEGELSVEEVLEAAQEAEAPIVGLEYADEETFGAYSGGIAGTEAETVLEAIDETADPETLVVKSLTVSGDFTDSGEGGEELRRFWNPLKSVLEGLTKSERKTPSVRAPEGLDPEPEPGPPPFYQPDRLRDPGGQEPQEPSIGEPGLDLPIIYGARLFGAGWDCLGAECDEPWAPETGWTDTPRRIEYSFGWGVSLEDMLVEIYEQGMPLAFELDVKLINPQNSDSQWNCPDSEKDDFWISDRDDWRGEISIPDAAGPYWDTSALDPCSRKDLTVGIYHPEELKKGDVYELRLEFSEAGNSLTSGIEWHAELLERAPGCDDSPWCVNVEPFYDDYRLPQVIIPYGYSWPFPFCYEYEYNPGRRGAGECGLPV
jgi:hypothetical protein